MAVLAGMYVWRGFLKLLPVVGIIAGTSLNKVLTARVGTRVRGDLRTRIALSRKGRERPPSRKKTAARRKASS
jgi:hypothetical protein